VVGGSSIGSSLATEWVLPVLEISVKYVHTILSVKNTHWHSVKILITGM